MIICPNCQYKNVTGAMFCAECGAQLDGVDTLITQAITDEQIAEELSKKAARPEPSSAPTNSWISLHLMDSGKILPLASRNEFTGRFFLWPPEMSSRWDVSVRVSRSCQILTSPHTRPMPRVFRAFMRL